MTLAARAAVCAATTCLALGLVPRVEAAPGGGIPLDQGWELSGASTRVESWKGERALRMRVGSAVRRDVSLADGTIEFDVAMARRRAFVYLLFRMASEEECETIYLRPHKSDLPDAVQYAPVWNGEEAWQLYHGRAGTVSASFPDGAWLHVRLVVQGRRAALFLGDAPKPALVVRLARTPAAGHIAFRSFVPPGGAPEGEAVAAFANVVVRPGDVPYDFGPDQAEDLPPAVVRSYQLSPPVAASTLPLTSLPADLLASKESWPSVPVEENGVLVIGRHVRRAEDVSTAVARLVVNARAATLQAMDLGYSDFVTVFVNGRPSFAGDWHYSFQEPRQDGFIGLWQARVWLPLVPGDNEVLLAVSDIFGGWGLTARLEPQDGVRLAGPPRERAAGSPAARSPLPLAAPAEVGFDPGRLDRLHASLARLVDEARCSGYVTLVARHGRIADWRAYGWQDASGRVRMQRDSIFRIASNSKLVTAVAAMILFEEGRLDLDASVETYLPELRGPKVFVGGSADKPSLAQAARPVTIRQLLSHTSGYGGDFGEDDPLTLLYRRARVDEATSMAELVARAATVPLGHQPGARFLYGISSELLGAVIEKASGQDLGAFLQERIFGPLGMPDTGFLVPPEKRARVVKAYKRDGRGGLVELEGLTDARALRAFPSGGGGLFSTAGDYVRFAQMLLNGGQLEGVRILGRKTVEYMTLNHLAGTTSPTHRYSPGHGFAFGAEVIIRPEQTATLGSHGQFGWHGGLTTSAHIDPAEDLVGIALFQHAPMNEPGVFARFPNGLYAALVDAPAGRASR